VQFYVAANMNFCNFYFNVCLERLNINVIVSDDVCGSACVSSR